MSLDEFADHGSDAGKNTDGWGIVYYAEDDIRRFRDVGAAATSEWVKFVERQALCSTLFMAHIRHANVGKISLPNTHPFSRELGGNMHTFAHNGYLQNLETHSAMALERFRRVGETDSEWAFCALLDRLCELWMADTRIPELADRFSVIATFASEIRQLGIANFIYSDGDAMFVHAHQRRQSDGEVRAPGLWLYEQTCPGGSEKVRGGGVKITSPEQTIIMAASVPLTEDRWEPMESGSLVALKNGEVLLRSDS